MLISGHIKTATLNGIKLTVVMAIEKSVLTARQALGVFKWWYQVDIQDI